MRTIDDHDALGTRGLTLDGAKTSPWRIASPHAPRRIRSTGGTAFTLIGVFTAVGTAAPPLFLQQPSFPGTRCVGSTLMTGVTIDFFDGTAQTIQWQFDGSNLDHNARGGRVSINTNVANGTSTLTIVDSDPLIDTGNYRVIAGTANNGSTISNTAIPVFFNAASVGPIAKPPSACEGFPIQLRAYPTGSDPANQSILWTIISGPDLNGMQFTPFPPIIADPSFTPRSPGTYTLRAETFDVTCDTFASANLMFGVHGELQASPTTAANETCIGSAVQLASNPTGGTGLYSFEWSVPSHPSGTGFTFSPDEFARNPTFLPTAAGSYQIQLLLKHADCNDHASGTMTIDVSDTFAVQAIALNPEFCLGDDTLVRATSGLANVNYLWTVSAGPNLSSAQFSNTAVSTPLFTPTAAGDYVLRVVGTSGICASTQSDVQITVAPALTVTPLATPATVCLGAGVQLDAGALGSGPKNQKYAWSISSGPSLNAAQWSNRFIANPIFTPLASTPQNTPYVLHVETTDLVCGTLAGGNVSVNVRSLATAAPSAIPAAGCEAEPLALTANAAGGAGTYTYRWSIAAGPSTSAAQFNDTQMATPTFTPQGGPGTYFIILVLTDASCLTTQPFYQLALPVVPALDLDPQPDTAPAVLGQPTQLRANLSGGTSPNVTWSIASLPANCDNDDPLDDPTLADPIFTPSCVGTYRLTVTGSDDSCDTRVTSIDVDVVVFSAEPKANPPAVCVGNSATLTPNVNGDFGPYRFAWLVLDGPNANISQFNDPAAESPAFTPTLAGSYTVQVTATDLDGVLPDITGTVDVDVPGLPPSFNVNGQPTSQQACLGDSVSLSVSAQGQGIDYQWRYNDADLPGESAATITLHPLRFSHAGEYRCRASNACGHVDSDMATLSVSPFPSTLFVVAKDAQLRVAANTDCRPSVNLATRGSFDSVAIQANGLAAGPNRSLYAALRTSPASAETSLASIDPFTSLATIIGTMGEPIADLAFDPAGQHMYAIRGNNTCPACPGKGQPGQMFIVDLGTAALLPLDIPRTFASQAGHAIAFDETGRLYHHGQLSAGLSRLVRADLQSTAAPEVLLEQNPGPEWTAMTFGPDAIWATQRHPLQSTTQLWSIDRSDFQATLVGNWTPPNGTVEITGMAFACGTFGDADCDGDIDLDDHLQLWACAAANPVGECSVHDVNADGKIDLADWAYFQVTYTGVAPVVAASQSGDDNTARQLGSLRR